VLIVEYDGGMERTRQDVPLETDMPHARSMKLSDANVDVLICGAISKPFQAAVLTRGIEVIPQICGNVECVLSAFVEGRLQQGEFFMPGCCQRRRQREGQKRRCRQNLN